MEPTKKSNGALIGAIVIILILILGGWYVWQSKVETPATGDETLTEENDELNTLENDLNTADTDIEANVINSVE
jgi:hypothetical protein